MYQCYFVRKCKRICFDLCERSSDYFLLLCRSCSYRCEHSVKNNRRAAVRNRLVVLLCFLLSFPHELSFLSLIVFHLLFFTITLAVLFLIFFFFAYPVFWRAERIGTHCDGGGGGGSRGRKHTLGQADISAIYN